MKKIILLFLGLAFLTFKNQAQTVTDYDGNVYNTVTIGTQTWLKENLKVTHYNNSDSIPKVTDNTAWTGLSTGARCYYNNDSAANASVYGALYNWFTVNDSRNLCPTGWHVPSDAEWNILEKYLDNTVDTTATGWVGTDIGGKLKETGTTHWNSPNAGATNSSGFSALPGGYRSYSGTYSYVGTDGYLWSATESDAADAWGRDLGYINTNVGRFNYNKRDGFSVRCVSDSVTTQINDNSIDKHIQIYPNPSTGKFNIEIEKTDDGVIEIYNVMGENVYSEKILNRKSLLLNLDVPNGIYFVKIYDGEKIYSEKIVIQ